MQQLENEPARRWFFSHEQDLWVWFDNEARPIGFQLAYGKYHNEHAIRWNAERGFVHYSVDDGEHSGVGKGVPLLLADGLFEAPSVLRQFLALAEDLPADIVEFVAARLREHPEYSGEA